MQYALNGLFTFAADEDPVQGFLLNDVAKRRIEIVGHFNK